MQAAPLERGREAGETVGDDSVTQIVRPAHAGVWVAVSGLTLDPADGEEVLRGLLLVMEG